MRTLILAVIAAAAPAAFPGHAAALLDGADEQALAESRVRWDDSSPASAAGEPPPVAAQPPRRHLHYSLGRPETDPDNVISKAALIRGAGTGGHLINALPPAALAGAGRLWGEMLAGSHGDEQQAWAVAATLLLPAAIIAVSGLALMVMVDNLIDAVDDAFKE